MKTTLLPGLLAVILAVSGVRVGAQTEKPPETPETATTVDKTKTPPPEEKEKKLKEFREKMKQKQVSPEAIAKLREEIKNLPPEERAARLKEFRERQKSGPLNNPDGDPRAKMRARFEKRLTDLRKKKADGTITEDETRQLERGEAMLKRAGRKAPEKAERSESNELPVPKVPPAGKSE